MKYIAHDYQTRAIDWCIHHPRCGLFLPMGAGKTVITLSAVSALKEKGEVDKVLIIAPIRVARSTWPAEIEKWDHTKHLTYTVIDGPEKNRLKALQNQSDIFSSISPRLKSRGHKYFINKFFSHALCVTMKKRWYTTEHVEVSRYSTR